VTTIDEKISRFIKVFNAYPVEDRQKRDKRDKQDKGGKMDNQFIAIARVSSNFPDEQGAFRDLVLHNEKTDKSYKVRAWFNVLNPAQQEFLDNLKVGEVAKFTIERKIKEYNGKTITFFNLANVGIPEIDVNEDISATPPKKGQDREDVIMLQTAAKVAAEDTKTHNLDGMDNKQQHEYKKSVALSWYEFFKSMGK